MSNDKEIEVILHCQKQFKKERLPDEKLLHYLGRLSRLRITVSALAETGIGRTVNSLSRNEGPVGQAADTLVRSWKQMVSEQQNQVEKESEESDSNSGSSDEDEENNDDNEPYEIEDQEVNPPVEEPYQNGHLEPNVPLEHSSRRNEDFGDEDEDDMDDIDDPYMENGFLDISNMQDDDEEEEDEDDNGNASAESDASDGLQIAVDDRQQIQREVMDSKVNPYMKQETRSMPHNSGVEEKGRDHKSSSQSTNSFPQNSSNSKVNHHYHQDRSDRSSSSNSRESSKDDKRPKDSKEHRSSKHTDHSENKSHHRSSKSHSEKEKNSSRDKDKHRSKESSSHRESKTEKERSKEKKDSTDKIRSSSSSNSSNHHYSKEKTLETTVSSLKKSSPEKDKKSESYEEKRRKDSPSEPVNGSSSSKKSKLVIKEEIDSTSGVNFADVLGSLDVTSSSSSSSSKHKKSKRDDKDRPHDSNHYSSPHKKKHESPSSNTNSSKHSRESSSSSRKHEKDAEGGRPSKKSAQSKIEAVIKPIVNISPNYKPMATFPRPGSSQNHNSNSSSAATLTQSDLSDLGNIDYLDNNDKDYSGMSQEDAISTMLSSRSARSKVFSGVKSGRRGAVPSLFDLCMQVIKDNIGDLGYTGGIPYDILKPALERASPQQLMCIESQNDYLIGETDELWQFHCRRDFRGRCPAEMESWRELYERCKEGQQQKFELIRNKMKRKIDEAVPVRTAKLAYVESSGGPRFNREKAQTIKNGMKTLKMKEEKGAKRGVASSASVGFNNPKVSGDPTKVIVKEASVIIAPGSRAGHAPAPPVSRESTAKQKPKKAPLMQKTMKLIRSLNRR